VCKIKLKYKTYVIFREEQTALADYSGTGCNQEGNAFEFILSWHMVEIYFTATFGM
jgi:hypothetical protein